MDVEQLVIQIGFDSEKFNAAIEGLQGKMEEFRSKIDELGSRMSDGMDKARQEAERAGSAVEQTAKQAQTAAESFSDFFQKLSTTVFLPISAFFSLKKVFDGYLSDVATAAEATGAYNKSLEEEARKKALLSRVTKQDIEIYVKGQRALANFQYAVQSVSNEVARSLSPALEKGVQWLEKITNWVSTNEHNLVRFFHVLAAVILTALLPAILKVTAALLANPLTWLIALITGLALVIDDLIVYIQGGESELEDFWKLFGTGAEIGEKLKAVWESLRGVWERNRREIVMLIAVFAGFKILQTVINLFTALGTTIRFVFAFLARNPFVLFIAAIADLIVYIQTGNSWLSKLWEQFGTGEEILNSMKSIWQGFLDVWAVVKNFIPGLIAAFVAFNALNGIVAGVTALKAAFIGLGSVFTISNPIIAILSALIGVIVLVITNWEELSVVAKRVWQDISNFVSAFADKIINGLIGFARYVSNILSNLWDTITTGVSNFISGLWNFISNGFQTIVGIILGIGPAIISAVGNIWDSITNGVKNFAKNLIGAIRGLWNSVLQFFSSINLFESGQKLISTFIDGIKAKASALIDSVKEIFSKVREYLPFSDAHIGPLSQLTLSGQRLITTIGEGTQQGTPTLLKNVDEALSTVSQRITEAFSRVQQKQNINVQVEKQKEATQPPIVQLLTKPQEIINEIFYPKQEPVAPSLPPSPTAEKSQTNIIPSNIRLDMQNQAVSHPTASREGAPTSPLDHSSLPPQMSSVIIQEAPARAESVQQVSILDNLQQAYQKIIPDSFQLSFLGAINAALSPLKMAGEMLSTMAPLPQPQAYAMAGIAPSITETNNRHETTVTQTTSVGQVTINTQATDARGIVTALPGAIETAFEHHKTYAAISGVRQ